MLLSSVRHSPRVDKTLFGYESPPDTPALNRDVFKWIHSLDLSHSIKNVRRDVANGFLVAEICSRYFPAEVRMHSFENATSSKYKKDNWAQVSKILVKCGVELPPQLIAHTMNERHGAAVALLELLYELFTAKKIERLQLPDASDSDAAPPPKQNMFGTATDSGSALAGVKAIASKAKDVKTLDFGGVQTKVVGDGNEIRARLLELQGGR